MIADSGEVVLASQTTFDYDSGPAVERGRLAVWLFLAAEAMFFGGLLSAWFVLRTASPDWTEGHPPSLVTGLVMTGLLAGASFMGHTAIGAAKRAEHKSLAARIGLAGLLVLTFLSVQALEYGVLAREGVAPSSSLRWGSFYTLTLCHGLHVLLGLVWLVYLFVRAVGPGLEREKSAPLEYGILYVHFVDVVWLVLLVLLYIVR